MSHSTTYLWLLRHGRPSAESEGRCYGALDLSLSDVGLEQARDAAAQIPENTLSAIYSSPRRRCTQTAEILRHRHPCPLETIDALSEINFGIFEGRTYDDIAATHPDVYRQWMDHPTEVAFPGGESFGEMQCRVLEAVDRLLAIHKGSSFAIVAHGGVNRIVIAQALGMPRENIFRIAQRYGALNLIRYLGDYPSVELLNR